MSTWSKSTRRIPPPLPRYGFQILAYFLKAYSSSNPLQLEEVRAAVHEFQQAQNLMGEGKYGDAINSLNLVMEKAPRFDKPRLLRGECFIKNGNADSAIVDLKYAVHLNADNLQASTTLSELQYSLGQVDEALECGLSFFFFFFFSLSSHHLFPICLEISSSACTQIQSIGPASCSGKR